MQRTIEQQIKELEAVEVLVATNEGTYGAGEACRATGTGDPAFANFSVYERVGGGRRVQGCDPARAPGYVRNMGQEALRTKRAELDRLRKTLGRKSRRERAA